MAATALWALTGVAFAAPDFQGRLADGTASTTCTKSGATKCAMFYNTTLNITILNDWNIGTGFWSDTAAAGSAQDLAESAGVAQTGFTGWLLPTGDGAALAGPLNQYLSIWIDVGSSQAGLQAQFDGVPRPSPYSCWSGTVYAPHTEDAWLFSAFDAFQTPIFKISNDTPNALYAWLCAPAM